MIKIILMFVLVFGIFFFGMIGFRSMTGKQQWALTKLAGYSIVCAVLTVLVMIALVLMF